jgi:hypothetical protein
MVESADKYKFTFIKYQNTDDHISYLIKVLAPGNISFTIEDRYSSMKKFADEMEKFTKNVQGFPGFPKKRIFGNKKDGFLKKRQRELETYFNMLFNTNGVSRSEKTFKYLKSRTVDDNSL